MTRVNEWPVTVEDRKMSQFKGDTLESEMPELYEQTVRDSVYKECAPVAKALAEHDTPEAEKVPAQAIKHDGGKPDYEVSANGMLKHTANKLRMEALPPEWKELLAAHMAFGAFDKKPVAYGLDNWRLGGDPKLLIAAAERHILAYQKGVKTDAESGSHHLVAAACNLLMLVVGSDK